MSTIDSAKKIITACEHSLRDLLSEAAKEGDYSSLSAIAHWAKSISALIDTSFPVASPKRSNRDSEKTSKERPLKVKTQYPYFKRSNDSLYKIGWSKKSKNEYRHNISYETVVDIVKHFMKEMQTENIYATEDLLPVTDRTGQEIPSYQVYICIAWLKEIGLLSQNGRQGYSMSNPRNTMDIVEKAWEALLNS